MSSSLDARSVLDPPVVHVRQSRGLVQRLLHRLVSWRSNRQVPNLPLCEQCMEPLCTEEEQMAGRCADSVSCSLMVQSDRTW